MKVDTTFTDRLVLLHYYRNSDGSLAVEEFEYGNLASTKRVEVKAPNAFAQFGEPVHTSKHRLMNSMGWMYINVQPSNQSEVTVIYVENGRPNNKWMSTSLYNY